MSNSEPASDRFRSATEFPKSITHLDLVAANEVYLELRASLVHSNRSRAQLSRWNQDYRQSNSQLRQQVERMQSLVGELEQGKRALAQEQQQVVTALTSEIKSLSTQLDRLSDAFGSVEDLTDPSTGQWNFFAFPSRLFQFLGAVKSIVLFWREENELPPATNNTSPQITSPNNQTDSTERLDQPHLHLKGDRCWIGKSNGQKTNYPTLRATRSQSSG